LKLCLDEHYSIRIAEELRGRDHDVVAVKERRELIASSDLELWAAMQIERRALLTENVADFMPLIQQAAAAGEDHWGIVFSSSRSMPRGAGTIGLFVECLDDLMRRNPAEDDLRNRIHWLAQEPG
jgi:Domain of unknown function (DUF5615)